MKKKSKRSSRKNQYNKRVIKHTMRGSDLTFNGYNYDFFHFIEHFTGFRS